MTPEFRIAFVLAIALADSAHAIHASPKGAQGAPASPVVYCAHDVAGVVFSLGVADDNGLDDDIRLVAGTYQPSIVFSTTVQESNYLKISGGWNADCSQQNGGQTVLDGQSQTPLLTLISQQNSDLVVSDITFVNGNAAVNEYDSALHVVTHGLAIVERNIFLANHSQSASTITLQGQVGTVAINNLVVANESKYASVNLFCGDTADSQLLAAGNTIFNNTYTTFPPGGMSVQCTVGMAYVANNILWGNSGSDLYLYLQNGGIATLYDNDIGVRIGFPPGPDSSGNFSAAPIFAGLLNFHPASTSPTINRGRNCITGGIGCEAALGGIDLGGAPRIQSQRVDIGAYESDVLFYSGFESLP